MKIKVSVTLKKLPTIDYRTLKELQGNLKDLTEKNYAKLLKSLTEFGFIVPFFVWKNGSEFYISDGHQRQRVLTKENATPYNLPYIEIQAKNKQEAKKKLLAISSQYGTITQEGWDEFTFDLDDNWLKETIQFDGLKDWDAPEAAEDDYVIPAEIKTDIKRGDLFQIGEHYLLCGDCTKSEDVEKLLDGNCPILCVTDPPYGVNYDPTWRHHAGIINSRRQGKVQNDDNARWLDAYLLFPGNVIYIWCASLRSAQVHQDIIDAGFIPYYLIIWNKQQAVFGRGNYHWKHEPCWYAVRKGKKYNWQGDRKQTTVWDITSILQSKAEGDEANIHGTQKPIECMARPIRNNSAEGESVYDPFVGSGTTLVAGQQLNRKVFAMEIHPPYVQVCIDRMKKSFPEIKVQQIK